ncbi:hypothetical protein [Anaeromassilibacillus sp. An200]|uniref:hypothetical protein n=1 Tax=Anaeromassilibacillus sp. An200 TaxID=1965587 RepID=UPI00111F582B|nr:hypothetical protein [Anaeromassilibacillus sp. An200]
MKWIVFIIYQTSTKCKFQRSFKMKEFSYHPSKKKRKEMKYSIIYGILFPLFQVHKIQNAASLSFLLHFAGKEAKILLVFSHNADSVKNAKKSFANGGQIAYSKEEIKTEHGFDKGVKAFLPFSRRGVALAPFFI